MRQTWGRLAEVAEEVFRGLHTLSLGSCPHPVTVRAQDLGFRSEISRLGDALTY